MQKEILSNLSWPALAKSHSKQALAQRGRDPQSRRAGCEYEARCAAHGRFSSSFFLVGTAHGEELAGAAGGGEVGGESLGVGGGGWRF